MHTLPAVIEVLAVGAVLTVVDTWLIERAHPPRGRCIDSAGLRQHVVELRGPGDRPSSAPPIVLVHGAGCPQPSVPFSSPT